MANKRSKAMPSSGAEDHTRFTDLSNTEIRRKIIKLKSLVCIRNSIRGINKIDSLLFEIFAFHLHCIQSTGVESDN